VVSGFSASVFQVSMVLVSVFLFWRALRSWVAFSVEASSSGVRARRSPKVAGRSSRVVVAEVSLFQNERWGVLYCSGPLDTVQTVITLKAPLGHRPLLHLPERSADGSP